MAALGLTQAQRNFAQFFSFDSVRSFGSERLEKTFQPQGFKVISQIQDELTGTIHKTKCYFAKYQEADRVCHLYLTVTSKATIGHTIGHSTCEVFHFEKCQDEAEIKLTREGPNINLSTRDESYICGRIDIRDYIVP